MLRTLNGDAVQGKPPLTATVALTLALALSLVLAACAPRQAPILRNTGVARHFEAQSLTMMRHDGEFPSPRVVDSWHEFGCGGVVVYARTDDGPVWVLWNAEGGLRDWITAEAIRSSLAPQVQWRPDAESWSYQLEQADGRPLYYLGRSEATGEPVHLRLQTDLCSLSMATVRIGSGENVLSF